MDNNELEKRTRLFALRVIRFVKGLPRDREGNVLGQQLLRSGTSIGANYREANRAESRKDSIHKIAIVERGRRDPVLALPAERNRDGLQ